MIAGNVWLSMHHIGKVHVGRLGKVITGVLIAWSTVAVRYYAFGLFKFWNLKISGGAKERVFDRRAGKPLCRRFGFDG
jgi:hypothetical protein